MSRIFISYKRADKEKVFAIKDKIEEAIGEKCWIDLSDIECDAKSWEDRIINAINESSIFLFMYSRNIAEIKDEEDDRTLDEFCFARQKNKRIVFVNIDKTPLIDKYAFRFGQRQHVDATSEHMLNKLIEDIKKWLGISLEDDIFDLNKSKCNYDIDDLEDLEELESKWWEEKYQEEIDYANNGWSMPGDPCML